MSQFAKLFEIEGDQVLVMIEEDNGPTVRFTMQPEGLGLCSVAARFDDDDAGWSKAEALFQSVDEASATWARTNILRSTQGLTTAAPNEGAKA